MNTPDSPPQASPPRWDPPSPMPARTGARRRVAFFITITILAALLSVIFLNVLAHRFRARVDVTAGGEQRLAPRTAQLLAALDGPHRLIVATDLGGADPRARRALQDVVDEFVAASPDFRASLLDTGSATGLTEYRALLQELVASEQPVLEGQRRVLDLAQGDARAIARRWGEETSAKLASAQEGVQGVDPAGAELLRQSSSLLRARAADLDEAGAGAYAAMTTTPAQPVPRTDQAASQLVEAMDRTARDAQALATQLRALGSKASTPGQSRREIELALTDIELARDRAQSHTTTLRGLERPDVVRIANALRGSAGALLVGPPRASTPGGPTAQGSSLVGLDLEQLLPAGAWIDTAEAARGDLRRRTEDVVAASLASLRQPNRPLVVLMHAEPTSYLDDAPFFAALRDRLTTRGVDMTEWRVADANSTDPAKAAPPDPRPRVYVTLAPETLATAGELTGPRRAQLLGEALSGLIGRGESVLVSFNPSILPGAGSPDPIAAALAPLGIEALTGTPLLSQVPTPRGAVIEVDRIATPVGSHVLAKALGSLPTLLPWAIPLRTQEGTEAILATPGQGVWGEEKWTTLRATPREQFALLREPPRFDRDRDRSIGDSAWTLGAVVQRELAARRQRVVAIGSNAWFADQTWQQTADADGRTVLRYPGNIELFEACVWWLSGRDELIAQSPTARSVSLVRNLEPQTLRWLRGALIAGLPGLVLLVGLLRWVLRGRG